MVDLVALKVENLKRWQLCRPLRDFSPAARRLVNPIAKTRYEAVQGKTGVPWFFIAVVHERESSQDFSRSLAQGDPWNKVSVHVPAGRGPFVSWEAAAIDALSDCPPFAAKNGDWSIGGLLTELESYNGFGYAARSLPSPYIWAGTDQYEKGKFVRDGFFDPTAVDQQFGCAGLLIGMMKLDSSIANVIGKKPVPVPTPDVPARNPIAAFLASILAFFRRK